MVKGWVAPPLVDYSVCKNSVQSSLLYSRGNQFVWNGTQYTKKNADMCWRVVILVQALNMHGNIESFTGLCPLNSTKAVVPWWKREAKSKAMWETGSRDSLWDPRSSASSHWATPLVSLQHTSSGWHRERKKACLTNTFNLQLSTFYSILHSLSWLSLHTRSRSTHKAHTSFH